MIYVLIFITAMLVLDGLRMRRRFDSLPVLEPSDEPATHKAIGEISDATLRAASAFMRAHQLDVLDIVPRDLPALRALGLAQLVDPVKYRKSRLEAGRTAGHAIVISDDVAARAHVEPVHDEVELARLARRLKHFGKADIAVAPGEHARKSNLTRRLELLQVALGPGTAIAIGFTIAMWGLMGYGASLHPLAGGIALGAWLLQPLYSLAGTPVHSRDLILATLFRGPIELYIMWFTLTGHVAGDTDAALARPVYDKLLADGTAKFHEPRRETCPLCDSRDLVVHLKNPDLFQHKPGTFTLERCRACSHVFQNPRLSLEGLSFYYKDFYDGLGEQGMEFVFGFGTQPYLDRARMVCAHNQPKRWLDVGAGHGHFCEAAREAMPDVQFDGLDLSDSIDEAKRRGWVDTSYRGLFPDLAPGFAGRYDAVSMSHYLEHTLDPKKEIEAAHTALAPNGTLMIEVPDPEFGLGKLLRRYWLPWFQPQHLHFVSVGNLEKLLRERGFEPVEWHRGKAHQRVDFFLGTWLLLDNIAPSRRLPWRWRGGVASAWRVFAWTLGSPLLVLGFIADNVAGPLVFSRARISNTYRVVARKTG